MSETPTYAAALTPPGSAAIATIAVRGPLALAIVEKLFQASGGRKPPVVSANRGLTPPARLADGTFSLGKFGEDICDEVVLIVKQTEPAPWIELHCHGGRQVVHLLLETLERQGVAICSWQDLERAATNPPLRTEAAICLAGALTVRTAAILLDQYHGAFEQVLQAVRAALDQGDAASAARLLNELARYRVLGRHLTRPWRVVVAGAPNVGKSSLVNALAGFQRSIVSAIPGTTRDAVSVRIALDGWPVELIDTAGLREPAGELEQQGIQLAEDVMSSADLCLWVLDGSAGGGENPSPQPLSPRGRGAFQTVVINKIDLLAAWDFATMPDAVRVSARTSEGLTELCQAIAGRLVPECPPPGAAVPFTEQWCVCVENARQALQTGDLAAVQSLLIE